jgi:hypothetical protein
VTLATLALALALPGSAGAHAVPTNPPAPAPVVALDAGLPALARLGSTPADGLRSRGAGPLTPDEEARRDAAIEALVAAEAQATESPETAEGPLQDALRGFSDVAPLVADDPRAQQARAFAQLALARTRLVLGRPRDAAAALDDALREAGHRPLPVDQFGPALAALHAERAAALAALPPASLTVRCTVPCRVLVDEHPVAGELLPGTHRVWVEAVEAGQPVLRRALALAPGQAETLDYAVEPAAPTPAPTPVVDEPRPARRRILPRWASALGLGAGASVAIAGGALVGVDHRCPDLSNPREVGCLRILDTDTGGLVLLGVGGAMAITAAVILTIDEVRARRARRGR